MKVDVVKKRSNRVDFKVTGIDLNMANSLRRIVVSEVPTLAIETVTVYQNSSVMDDEVLAHRLGLVPLKTDPNGPDTVEVVLKAEGPGVVHADQLQVKGAKSKKKSDSMGAYDKMPIIKLREKQRIELEALAQMGRGNDHIKWQGGLASYKANDDGSFDFFIETYGQMPLEELVDNAFKVMEDNIKDLKKVIK